jgi:hypothetical protein
MSKPVAYALDDAKWKAQRDLETLIEASKIRKDADRMKAVKKCAKERKEELANNIGEVSKIEDTDKDGD